MRKSCAGEPREKKSNVKCFIIWKIKKNFKKSHFFIVRRCCPDLPNSNFSFFLAFLFALLVQTSALLPELLSRSREQLPPSRPFQSSSSASSSSSVSSLSIYLSNQSISLVRITTLSLSVIGVGGVFVLRPNAHGRLRSACDRCARDRDEREKQREKERQTVRERKRERKRRTAVWTYGWNVYTRLCVYVCACAWV